MIQITGWKYYYRRYLGWFPVQFCVVCGRPYWGGFPEMEIYLGRLVSKWQAWMMEYCSLECCEKDTDL